MLIEELFKSVHETILQTSIHVMNVCVFLWIIWKQQLCRTDLYAQTVLYRLLIHLISQNSYSCNIQQQQKCYILLGCPRFTWRHLEESHIYVHWKKIPLFLHCRGLYSFILYIHLLFLSLPELFVLVQLWFG